MFGSTLVADELVAFDAFESDWRGGVIFTLHLNSYEWINEL